MSPEQTVFVIDDEPRMRDSLGRLLTAAGFSTRLFSSAEDFLEAYEPAMRGCLIVDVRLEGQSGLDLQRKLAGGGMRVPIIVISAYADVPSVVRAVKDGAIDFLEKPFAAGRLLTSVRQALADDARIRSEEDAEAGVRMKLASLTRRERQTLDLVLEGKTTKQIARQLEISPKTVDNHRTHMFRKMNVDGVVELLRELQRLK